MSAPKSPHGKTDNDLQETGSTAMHKENTVPQVRAKSIFELALRARNERALMPTSRVVKAPSRIKPTKKIRGWFRCHPTVLIGPIDIFDPKEEGSFSEEPVFILPELADQLRRESTTFENAVSEVLCYLIATKGGAMYLFLAPLPDPATGLV